MAEYFLASSIVKIDLVKIWKYYFLQDINGIILFFYLVFKWCK